MPSLQKHSLSFGPFIVFVESKCFLSQEDKSDGLEEGSPQIALTSNVHVASQKRGDSFQPQ